MAEDPKVRFFLGANSPSGFYSLYDQLLPPEEARDFFILKGGAGCGKSTLMRRVAAGLEERGLEVEYIECSGDPDSLDAVVIPALKTALVDGTAPHVVEPRYPGAVERYVNLGACYDHEGLTGIREEIMEDTRAYQACYGRAYRCLLAAAQIEEDMRELVLTPAAKAKAAKRARGILAREIKKTGREPGHGRQRFLGGITCRGEICRFDTAQALCRRVYELSDSYGLAHELLTHLASGAVAAGYDVIVCPSPMFPERMEHLLIPALSLAFVSSTSARPYPGRPVRRVRMDAMLDQELLRRSRARLRFSRRVTAALLEEAVGALAQAKERHDTLEAAYHPWVDFARVEAEADEILAELLKKWAESDNET